MSEEFEIIKVAKEFPRLLYAVETLAVGMAAGVVPAVDLENEVLVWVAVPKGSEDAVVTTAQALDGRVLVMSSDG